MSEAGRKRGSKAKARWELSAAESALAAHGVRHTVVVRGGSRAVSEKEAHREYLGVFARLGFQGLHTPEGRRLLDRALRAWKGAASGPPAFSTSALLAAEKKEFDAYAQELARGLAGPDAPTYADYTFAQSVTFEVLSVVGPLVSLAESGGGDTPGAAHPSGYHVLRTRDVLRKDATPSLLDFFSEKDVVAALKADPFVRKFGNPEKGFARAASLKDLLAALDRDWARENSEAPASDCGFEVSFDASMVEQFYFHHLEKGRVAVRVALAPANEWCNRIGGRTELGLLLPIPDALRGDLLEAQSGEAGFLAANRKAAGSPSFSDSWQVDIRTLVPRR